MNTPCTVEIGAHQAIIKLIHLCDCDRRQSRALGDVRRDQLPEQLAEMSALLPITDMEYHARDVRFVPITDITLEELSLGAMSRQATVLEVSP